MLAKPNEAKLVLTLKTRKTTSFTRHYSNLQFYLKLGMKLKRVHRTLEFDQECWMEPYIRMNMEFPEVGHKQIRKNFYKLTNTGHNQKLVMYEVCLGPSFK